MATPATIAEVAETSPARLPKKGTDVTTARIEEDGVTYIRTRFRSGPAPAVPEIRLFQPHPASGLTRFVGEGGRSPYWAYGWAGGTVLARYILDHPQVARGRRVLDLGAGSGIVAIAAAKAGAARVEAVDIDPTAGVAARLNARENDVAIDIRVADGLAGPPPGVDLVTVGDLFYESALAARVVGYLDRCRFAGIEVVVGDPGRQHLPRHRLRAVAVSAVPDFAGTGAVPAAVYAFEPDLAGASAGRFTAPARSGTATGPTRRHPPGRGLDGR